MCGVASIVYGGTNPAIGREIGELVRRLEYRGYDSTGAAVIAEDGSVVLRKKVGAPSRVVRELRIDELSGEKAIGQVRWATYGSVTDENAQPHDVRCRIHVVGAHNGNVSNTDRLKELLRSWGHAVVSDNDGEMLVHVVEHMFADELEAAGNPTGAARFEAALSAIRRAKKTIEGSWAAVVSLPGIDGVFAMKAGSSLYAGRGSDAAGEFAVASSDLTSVLAKTRFLIPLAEGEGVHLRHDGYAVFSFDGGDVRVPPLRRSRLEVADVELKAGYRFFMEQEIDSAAGNLEDLVRYYFARSWEKPFFDVFEKNLDDARALLFDVGRLATLPGKPEIDRELLALLADPRWLRIRRELDEGHPAGFPAEARGAFESDEKVFFGELAAADPSRRESLLLLDHLVLWKKKRRVLALLRELQGRLRSAGRIVLVGSGTSHHACQLGALFFADLAGVVAEAVIPGQFRSIHLGGLKAGDLVVAVTQSGETKDLVDVFNDVRGRHGKDVSLVALVNNENSTIPQEKADFFLPILCGPETAVAATKSFISQAALFLLLAASLTEPEEEVRRRIGRVREGIDRALAEAGPELPAAAKRLAFAPSIHILGTSLAGLAKEGALKIREVVLNHTEGYDSAEFKHGPNTILGRNTLFSFEAVEEMLGDFAAVAANVAATLPPEESAALLERIARGGFGAAPRGLLSDAAEELWESLRSAARPERLFRVYPLVFLSPPDERDARITVTQIHTHKIRGASVLLFAEENDDLKRAVLGKPAGIDGYEGTFIRVPPTGDRHAFAFQAAVLLQRLAFLMSIEKMSRLDALGIEGHGVHPDVPKNVSKSITVD
jgi:glucosamine 6-phosphate synthetase-like amidotransferase/phosphosugar isomerase protein